jgi:hypothetical protein
MNYTFKVDLSSDDSLKGGFGAVWNDLRVDESSSFQDSENDCFPIGSTANTTFLSTRAKKAFINFDRPSEGGLRFTKLGDSQPDGMNIPGDGISIIFATLLIWVASKS